MEESNQEGAKPKMGLPLHEDDMAIAMGHEPAEIEEELAEESIVLISYTKLFITLALAAPVAAFLVMIAIDLYPGFALMAGLRKSKPKPPPIVKVQAKPKASTTDDKITSLLAAVEKSNNNLAFALQKNYKVMAKIASKKAEVIKIESQSKSPKITVQSPKITIPPPKVIVVKVPSREKFDLAYEKQKILDLAGVDLDDPITGPKDFNNIISRDTLKELIRSFDTIIGASRTHAEVSEFVKKNALAGKGFASRRLRKLK